MNESYCLFYNFFEVFMVFGKFSQPAYPLEQHRLSGRGNQTRALVTFWHKGRQLSEPHLCSTPSNSDKQWKLKTETNKATLETGNKLKLKDKKQIKIKTIIILVWCDFFFPSSLSYKHGWPQHSIWVKNLFHSPHLQRRSGNEALWLDRKLFSGREQKAALHRWHPS